MKNEANFYVVGGTLSTTAPSYVSRKADEDLYNGLSQGEFCYVLTSRQMGKSSLMTRIAARLRQEEVAVVILDLTAIGTSVTQEQWYYGLLDRIGTQLKLDKELEEFWQEHMQLGPLQRWTSAIRDVVLVHRSGRVVIFVDEIDQVRSLPFSTDDFFAAIRECHNRRTQDPEFNRLTFCLLGVATPADLIQDPRTTPFNIGRRIELTDFTVHEAGPLAQGLDLEPQAGAQLLERVLYWTNGHPYLTQRLCQAVAADANAHAPDDVDRQCEEMFLSARARERDPNLLFVREGVLRNRTDVAGLLDLYSRVHRGKRVQDDETNPLVNTLRLAGLTRVEGGYLHCRNRIYKRVFDRNWISESMPDIEIRRQRAALRRGVGWTALAASLIIGAGLWYWDAHYRQIEEHYSAITTRWGGPEGIGKLSWDEVRHRQASIKLTRHGRKNPVEELAVIDSRGRCPYQPIVLHSLASLNLLENKSKESSSDNVSEFAVTCRVVFAHNTNGHVINQRGYNRNERLLYELQASASDPNVIYYKRGDVPEARRESGITHVELVRANMGTAAGLTQEVHFKDAKNQPRPDRGGSYGRRYIFDDQGLPTEEINLDTATNPTASKAGIAKAKRTYDERGNVVKLITFGLNDQVVAGQGGVAGVDMNYDIYGNLIKMSFFGTDNQLVMPTDRSAAVVTRGYDEHGELAEMAFFGPDQQPLKGADNFARATLTHREGGITLETYFGVDGKPVRTTNGFIKARTVRDERGNIVEVTTLDENEQPIRNKDGYSTIRHVYDKHGHIEETAFFDEQGQLIRTLDGYAKIKRLYDDRGNNIESSAFGPDGEPALVDDCYVKITWQYSDQGKTTELAYFNKDNKLTKCKNGFARLTQAYDTQGNITEVAYFDENGQPTPHKDGYAKLMRAYDERDNLTEETSFDANGKPIRDDDGYVTGKMKYDNRGNRLEIVYLDENRQPVLLKDGYARVERKFNEKNQQIEGAYFGVDGSPAVHKEEGYARVIFTYDAQGNITETQYFNAYGQLARPAYGYVKKRFTYDDLGRESTRVHLDANDQPIQTKVAVIKVEPKSKAQIIGFQKDDFIISYDGKDPVNTYVFGELLIAKGNGPREIKVLRNGKEVSFQVDPGKIDGLETNEKVPPQSLVAKAQAGKKQ